jgi:hypothetical protein
LPQLLRWLTHFCDEIIRKINKILLLPITAWLTRVDFFLLFFYCQKFPVSHDLTDLFKIIRMLKMVKCKVGYLCTNDFYFSLLWLCFPRVVYLMKIHQKNNNKNISFDIQKNFFSSLSVWNEMENQNNFLKMNIRFPMWNLYYFIQYHKQKKYKNKITNEEQQKVIIK